MRRPRGRCDQIAVHVSLGHPHVHVPSAGNVYFRADRRICTHRAALHDSGRGQQLRPVAERSHRFLHIKEMTDNIEHPAVQPQVFGRTPAWDDQRIVRFRLHLVKIRIECKIVASLLYQGVYLFGGTASTAPPFVLNASAPSGVQYLGNTDVNSVQLGPGQNVPINVPGSQIFNNGAGDVFQALHDLASALNANNPSGVQTAGNEVTAALQAVSAQRTFYGVTTQRLQALDTFLSTEKVQLSQQATSLAGANPAQVATQLSEEEVTSQATMSAEAKVLSQPDLFSYLPS